MNHLGNTAYTKQFAETYRTPVAAVLRADTGQHPMRDYASALTVLQKYRNEIPADMHNQLLEYYVFKLEPLYFDQIAQGNTEYIKLYRKHIKNNEFAMRYAEVKGMQKKTAMQAWETRLNAAVKRGKSGQGYDELKTIITMCPHPSIVVRATNQYYAITPKVRTQKALFLDYVPIHQAADFSATVLRRDSFDKEYVVLGKVGEFYRIELDLNSVGYIHHEFIKEHERQ